MRYRPKSSASCRPIFRQLVTVGTLSDETPTRKTVPLAVFSASSARAQFVRSFVEARLLTSDVDDLGTAVVRITHESLLSRWQVLQSWLADDRELMLVRSRLDAAASLWISNGRRADLLLPSGKPLQEAELLVAAGFDLDESARDLIVASRRRARRNRSAKRSAVAALCLLATGFATFAVYAMVKRNEAIDVNKKLDKTNTELTKTNEISQRRMSEIKRSNTLLTSVFQNVDKLTEKGEKELRVVLGERLEVAVDQLESDTSTDPLGVAETRMHLGIALMGLGYYEKGVKTLELARDTFRAKLGLDDEGTRTIIDLLSVAYHALGRMPQAIEQYELLYTINSRVLGAEEASTVDSLMNLAEACDEVGKSGRAVELTEQALVTREKSLGGAPADTRRRREARRVLRPCR